MHYLMMCILSQLEDSSSIEIAKDGVSLGFVSGYLDRENEQSIKKFNLSFQTILIKVYL